MKHKIEMSRKLFQLRAEMLRIVMKLFSLLVAFSFCFSAVAQVNQRQIQGTVTDEKGESVIASIMIKGTTLGTYTDANGAYELNVPGDNTVLVVQCIGYKTKEIAVGNQRRIDIVLEEDSKLLDEVVVVGYGTQKRATITGSVASVKGEDLQKSPVTNLSSTLAGRLSGVTVNTRGSSPGSEEIRVNIRGKSSWQGGDPLIIIDGIANRSGWGRINPDEVESISVLKDASAAIYGSRAANGVILITTKRGKEGRPVLEYHGDVGFSKITRLPEMTRSWQYATYFTEAKRSGYIFTPEEIQKFKDGSDPNLYPNYELNDYILRSSTPQTTQTISIHGGNDAVKYYITGKYLYQDAAYKDGMDNFNSYGIRSNLDIKIVENLNFSINLVGRRDDKRLAVGSDYSTSGSSGSSFSGKTLLKKQPH